MNFAQNDSVQMKRSLKIEFLLVDRIQSRLTRSVHSCAFFAFVNFLVPFHFTSLVETLRK